jgi:hypothetical protein
MPGQTQVNVNGYKVEDDSLTDDLFNLAIGATLVLLGENAVLNNDAFNGPGVTRVRAPTSIDHIITLSGSTLFVNTSTITQDANTNCTLVLGQSFDDSVVVRNNAGSTWYLGDNASILGGGAVDSQGAGGASEFVNFGLLDQTGIDYSPVDANFYDRGGTILANGLLQFDSPDDVNRFVDDTIGGSGTFELDDGVLVNSNISTASVDLDGTRAQGNVKISSGDLEIWTLAINNDSVVSVSGGNINLYQLRGGGTLDISGESGLAGGVDSGNQTTLVGAVTLDNQGDLTVGGNYFLTTRPYADDQVLVENSTGATWTDGSGINDVFSAQGAGTSTFLNDGTFVDSTTNGTSFNIAVVNNGDMESTNGGTLNFFDGLSGVGAVDVGDGNAYFASLASSNQTINFNASNSNASPTLTLIDPSVFNGGTITGFDQNGANGDQITTSQAEFNGYFANVNNTGGYLEFDGSSANPAFINLLGNYSASGWHAVNNTSTGMLDITYGT